MVDFAVVRRAVFMLHLLAGVLTRSLNHKSYMFGGSFRSRHLTSFISSRLFPNINHNGNTINKDNESETCHTCANNSRYKGVSAFS